ncbi:MAG: RHS repeat-associated core domain-containing protein, partial [Caldilineaceae bacterium]|nr:RHS repeat-associated core domain-containing protein [Caldilineaceae bacterium]
GSEQRLVRDAENRLAEVQDAGGHTLERYGYDAGGARVRKVSGATATYTFFAHYEEEATNGVTTAISHYSYGGLRIAVKRGSTLYHVHGDHPGSTSLKMSAAGVEGGRDNHLYGAQRSAWGTLHTDRTFTGQKEDGTGLLYYNARYYDPALGAFISPDSIVPDIERVVDYNRFLFARGNPLKYSDPTGYSSQEEEGCSTQVCWEDWFKWNDRWYRARGYQFNAATDSWSDRIIEGADFADMAILTDMLHGTGISIELANWTFDELKLLGQGVVEFGYRIGEFYHAGVSAGFGRLRELTGRVIWYRADIGPEFTFCYFGAACALGSARVGFYGSVFDLSRFALKSGGINADAYEYYIRGTAVHESAHKIDSISGDTPNLGTKHLTNYSRTNSWEYWAEAVTDWVYGKTYKERFQSQGVIRPYYKEYERGWEHLNSSQITLIEGYLRP